MRFYEGIGEVLGHVVSSEGIKPEDDNVQNIISFKKPSTVDEIRLFLGIVCFYKRFIPNFAEKAQPMFDLLKKGRTFNWDDDCEVGYQYLKDKVNSTDVLIRPKFSDDFIVHTDASDKAVGFVLSQVRVKASDLWRTSIDGGGTEICDVE